ncbi:DUF6669 family protein [Anaerocolumna xylanovorans]|uniref:Uncharacterized protein n=1 Tax=Anaerocolumna xylanovorans DSM 12503 TaxID=1121345 RepID=A0A1M7YKQ1_9FIRM|nr:DUF6669 family protein [Anaerocolumna xylanovorans]SHO53197.1 hypothetical protein SAMN02745217_03994 [Anaerocolumna xylanovorans DSM 12503]
MKTIYTAGGILNKGFVGQISYTVCLDKEYHEMDIAFTFDKQHYTDITEELKAELTAACEGEYETEIATEEQINSAIAGMKTEIHTIATMNDNFIGGIHKQLTERHMHYSTEYTSEGCLPQESLHGVIRLTLVVFNVILDDTHYEVTLSVNEEERGGLHV